MKQTDEKFDSRCQCHDGSSHIPNEKAKKKKKKTHCDTVPLRENLVQYCFYLRNKRQFSN